MVEVATTRSWAARGNQHRPKYIICLHRVLHTHWQHTYQLCVLNDGVSDQSVHGGGPICSIRSLRYSPLYLLLMLAFNPDFDPLPSSVQCCFCLFLQGLQKILFSKSYLEPSWVAPCWCHTATGGCTVRFTQEFAWLMSFWLVWNPQPPLLSNRWCTLHRLLITTPTLPPPLTILITGIADALVTCGTMAASSG